MPYSWVMILPGFIIPLWGDIIAWFIMLLPPIRARSYLIVVSDSLDSLGACLVVFQASEAVRDAAGPLAASWEHRRRDLLHLTFRQCSYVTSEHKWIVSIPFGVRTLPSLLAVDPLLFLFWSRIASIVQWNGLLLSRAKNIWIFLIDTNHTNQLQ